MNLLGSSQSHFPCTSQNPHAGILDEGADEILMCFFPLIGVVIRP